MGLGVIKLCMHRWMLLSDLPLGQRVECDIEKEISWAVGKGTHFIKPGWVESKGPFKYPLLQGLL